ncbi:hypothetical protein DFH28DRAFT_1132715 [Melampsora americana]|nr:hypothetical protein DFH28DRAFT_1132715 [Melampsora americana]
MQLKSSIINKYDLKIIRRGKTMSFPELFDQLGFPNSTTRANPPTTSTPEVQPPGNSANPLENFDEAYGNQQAPIEIDRKPTTPAESSHNEIEIISISSDSEATTRGTRATKSAEPNREKIYTAADFEKLAEISAQRRQQARKDQAAAKAPTAPTAPVHPDQPVATQPEISGYRYNPNYPSNPAAPYYTYPTDPSHGQQSQHAHYTQPAPYHMQQPPPQLYHQYPSTSNQVFHPPPPPPGPHPSTDEEARLKAAEAHRQLEEFWGGRRHRHRVDELTEGYNPVQLNPRTMQPFEEPRQASTLRNRKKRVRDDQIDDLADDALDLLDMIKMVKSVKRKKDGEEKEKQDPKGKGKEKEE